MQLMSGLDDLRDHGGMIWIEGEHGWAAAPEEVVDALSIDGFDECKRETTVASAIWVNRPAPERAVVFIAIDGEPVKSGVGPDADPYTEDGGEA